MRQKKEEEKNRTKDTCTERNLKKKAAITSAINLGNKIVGNNGTVWNIEKKQLQATNQETYSIIH